jgi:hypothetical protein
MGRGVWSSCWLRFITVYITSAYRHHNTLPASTYLPLHPSVHPSIRPSIHPSMPAWHLPAPPSTQLHHLSRHDRKQPRLPRYTPRALPPRTPLALPRRDRAQIMLNIKPATAQLLVRVLLAALSRPLHETRRPAKTDQHSRVIGRQGVEHVELGGAEPLGEQPDAQRDQRRDEHGEADCGDGLRDGDRGGYGGELDCYEEEDFAARDEE